MKKHLSSLIILLLISNNLMLQAQDEKLFRFGVIGGMNLSNVKADLDNRVGFHAGVKAEYALPLNFYLESGLMFTQKGYKLDHEELDIDIDQTNGYEILTLYKEKGRANKNMLQLPIHAGYKYAISPSFKIFGSAGGYLAYGLSGKTKAMSATVEQYRKTNTTDIIEIAPQIAVEYFESKTYDIEKRFDWGLGLKAGVELFNRLQVSASYDWGINKLYSGTSEGNNRNFMVSCAFMIF